jgi:hypothetical protein
MDPILQAFLNWQMLTFGVAVASVMFVLRKIVEFLIVNYFSQPKETKLWNDLLLPILPVILGSSGSLIFKTFPYPDGLSSTGSRFIFGLVAGLLSTLFYRVIKSMLNQKIKEVGDVVNGVETGQTVDPVSDLKNTANEVKQIVNKEAH